MYLKYILPLHKRVLVWCVYAPLNWFCETVLYKAYHYLTEKVSNLDDYIWREDDNEQVRKYLHQIPEEDILECTYEEYHNTEKALLRYAGSRVKIIPTWSIKIIN